MSQVRTSTSCFDHIHTSGPTVHKTPHTEWPVKTGPRVHKGPVPYTDPTQQLGWVGVWDRALQQELGTFPRPTRRVGNLEMFKINNSIVGGLKGHSAFVAPFTTRLACLVPQIIRLAPGRFVAEIELTNMEPRQLIHLIQD